MSKHRRGRTTAWMCVALVAALLIPASAAGAASDSIFGQSKPGTVDSGDSHSTVLGVKFSSEVAGSITGIRFYKATTNTGTHTGSLWSASGTLLASATFTTETASGWQQLTLPKPVAISPNTTYVASYLAPKGHYSDTPGAFLTAISSPPLSALANTTSANGVYAYATTNTFPTSTYKATNYSVDVEFEPSTLAAPGTPGTPTATAGHGSATVNWTAPTSGGPASSYTITPYIGTQAQATTTITGNPPTTSTTITGLTNGTTYTFTITATNATGSSTPSPHSNPTTPTTESAASDSIFGQSKPGTVDSGDSHSTVLGVKFSSEVAGSITGIRFYKATTNTGTHTGSLWSASGTLLASATFTTETASGWQQLTLPKPVAISPNTTYVASYLAPKGHYSDTPGAFLTAISSPPLSALANTTSANGVYAYATTNTFPTSTYKATNYSVDVEFEPSTLAAPGTPGTPTATAGHGSATVNWTAPTSGGPASSYTITPYIGTQAQATTTITGNPPTTSTTITGLTNGTTYTFTITATNATGSSTPSPHSNPTTPTTESSTPIAYPDLQVLMPTGEISVHHTESTRTLEFTHITENAGAGPFELRPVYNPLTGISQGYQALYTMPSPGVWKYANSVPFAGPMLWEPPSDYRFPLDKFTLLSTSAGGGLGSVVATSPKALFCMTSDTYVGGVENTPNNNGYPAVACTEPEGHLGLSVGWGDQYDATDGGEGIDISSLPNGTYWLQGEVNPDHNLIESNPSNDVTDTKLQIEGNTVKVLEQSSPEATPPTVALSSPSAGSTLSGTVELTASASGPAPISSIQFLLDGQPIGAPVTTPPYSIKWPSGSISTGSHFLSAQATDGSGAIGTAPDVQVSTHEGSSSEGPDTEAPTVAITNPVAGETLSNTRQITASASDNVAVREVQFYLDGQALGAPVTKAPYAIGWDTTTASNASHTLTASATDTSGNVGHASAVDVTVQNPAEEGPCFVMDVNTTVNGHGTVTTQPFITAEAEEQLVAFVSSDGPSGAGRQSATVSGAGLTWTLVQRANSQSGDAEIWEASAPTELSDVKVTSTPLVAGYDQSLTVIAMQMSHGIGASASAGGATGAPSVSLHTTEEGSLVYAVGNDWSNAVSRALGSNQVLLRQYLDTNTGDTFWSQYTGQVTGALGSEVTLNDTAPTNDRWNMAAVEILGDGLGA